MSDEAKTPITTEPVAEPAAEPVAEPVSNVKIAEKRPTLSAFIRQQMQAGLSEEKILTAALDLFPDRKPGAVKGSVQWFQKHGTDGKKKPVAKVKAAKSGSKSKKRR